MSNEITYRFRLNGMDYALRGEKTPEEMEQIVLMVEQRIADIYRVAPHYSGLRAATLTALQLAEELLGLRQEYAALQAGASGAEPYDLFHLTQKAECRAPQPETATDAAESAVESAAEPVAEPAAAAAPADDGREEKPAPVRRSRASRKR